MNTVYTIRVESNNPEFDVSEELRKGVQVEGYVLLAIKNGDPFMESINGLTTMQLADFFNTGTDACSILRQAAAIGEGMQKARKIREEIIRDKMAKGIAGKMARKIMEEE